MGCVIELTSITYAIKARDLLRKNKIKATIEKSSDVSKNGCAYSLKIVGDCKKAFGILQKNRIEVLNIL